MLNRNTEGKDGENEKRSNVERENGWGYSRIDERLGCSYLEVQEEHNSVTEPNLGPLAPNAAKLIYGHWVVVKENIASIAECSACVQKTQTPWWLSGKLCFVFNLLIYFNWEIITLQYSNGFCHTSILISPKGVF